MICYFQGKIKYLMGIPNFVMTIHINMAVTVSKDSHVKGYFIGVQR